ncbi:MAG TPA: ATP-binding protein [Gemmatimonadaceae bacterium]|nr:ATP-binding protein [Gemmatimonadaceae bacterium]
MTERALNEVQSHVAEYPATTQRAEESDPAERLFAGPGEMRALCRSFDWSKTPLGPVATWPLSLRTTVATLLASRHPMFLFWGPELVQFYNDAYRPSLAEGGRHPRALGMRGNEFWTDIWHIIGPQIAQVLAGGEATWHQDHLVPIERNRRLEEVYWTYSYGPAYGDDGGVAGVLVVCQETTSRVLTERRLQTLNRELEVERSRLAYVFQQAPTFLAILRGSPLSFELVNEAYYRLVGHRELVGRPVFEALPEARGQGFETLLASVVETGKPYIGKEVSVKLSRTPGAPPEERILDFVYFPLVEADGSRSGVIAHGVDITEHVEARREIERLLIESERARHEAEAARAEADAANRSKGEFLAVMSHELRTPLNAIGGYAELMELGIRGPITEQQRADLERIQQSQKHLLGLINQVLNYTRVETGAVTYTIEDVRVCEVLATAEALVAPQVRAKGLTFVLGAVDASLRARVDSDKLQQILLNLLANAIKFTEPGGEVTVVCSGTHDTVAISVSDTGLGIAPDKLAAVFEPFFQVDQRFARQHQGVGLGLAISRDLARGMGGDLVAASTPGVGSTFTLTLPAI